MALVLDDREKLVNCCLGPRAATLLKGHPESDQSGVDKLDSLSIIGCQFVYAQDLRTCKLG